MPFDRYFLGIHTGHDRGATLIDDTGVLLHIPEDRLDRVKHSESQELPILAIQCILDQIGCKLGDLGGIGISCVNRQSDVYLSFYTTALERQFGVSVPEVVLAGHHLCHALCCTLLHDRKETFAYIYDGAGDLTDQNMMESETLFRIADDEEEILHQRVQDYHETFSEKTQFLYSELMYDDYRKRQVSLGKKYNQFTARCGFGAFEDGKTMGLAPYGSPLFNVTPHVPTSLDFSLTVEDLLCEANSIREAKGMDHYEFDRDHQADLAATIQDFLEQSLLSVGRQIVAEFGPPHLALSGGVALNCVANHKLAKLNLFEAIYPFPAAGDDGQSIGAALHAKRQLAPRTRMPRFLSVYSGPEYSDADVKDTIASHGLTAANLSDPKLVAVIASAIRTGQVVGLFRGRSEVGPRALGHRSIIASATHPKMKDILNERVKYREMFRPYAPMVSAESAYRYFDIDGETPHMMFAVPVRNASRAKVPSVTHIDGTARVQTVSQEQEPFLHDLLVEVERQCGEPIIINTSFNLAGEPIVETPEDAIRTFLRSRIDILILGNEVVDRSTNKFQAA